MSALKKRQNTELQLDFSGILTPIPNSKNFEIEGRVLNLRESVLRILAEEMGVSKREFLGLKLLLSEVFQRLDKLEKTTVKKKSNFDLNDYRLRDFVPKEMRDKKQ